LEVWVEGEFGALLDLRLTSGSGNHWGDGDLKSKSLRLDGMNFGFECKRTTTTKNHVLYHGDLMKAIRQIEGHNRIPVIVTQNSLRERMVHLRPDDFKLVLELVKEALEVLESVETSKLAPNTQTTN
jgi:hypothetical protein